MQPTRYYIVSIVYALGLVFIAFHYWKRFKKESAAGCFNFRITDIWAAMAAIAPTFFIVTVLIEENESRGWQRGDLLSVAILLLVLGVSQLVGLFVGRIRIELPPRSGARTAWESAVSIVAGGLLGLLFSFAFALAAFFKIQR